MKIKSTCASNALVAAALGGALAVATASSVLAQEKCTRTIPGDWAKSKYTEQHVMDVGDMPGHQIRIFEIHRTFTDAEPNCEGLKRKEQWARGFSDYVDRNGRAWGYVVTTMENGDQTYGRFTGISHTEDAADGKKSTYVGTTVYTGGTGTYEGIQGLTRDTIRFDPEANVNIVESQDEYWIEK